MEGGRQTRYLSLPRRENYRPSHAESRNTLKLFKINGAIWAQIVAPRRDAKQLDVISAGAILHFECIAGAAETICKRAEGRKARLIFRARAGAPHKRCVHCFNDAARNNK